MTLYLGLLAVLLAATLRAPASALAAVLCLYALEQWGQVAHPLLLHHHRATNLAIGALVVCALVLRALRGGRLLADYPAVGAVVLALFGCAATSLLWTPDPGGAAAVWRLQLPYLLVAVGLAPLLVRDGRDLDAAFDVLLIVGLALLAMLLLLAQWDNRRIVIEASGNGVYGNPLEVATLAAGVLIVAVFHRPRLLRRGWILFQPAAVLLCTAAIAIAGARGQLAGVLAAVILLWPVGRRVRSVGRFAGWVLAAALLAAAVAWSVQHFGAGNQRWSGERMEADVSGRLLNATTLLSHWAAAPGALAAGLGNSASYALLGIYPHNVPAEVLAEEGVVGFALYLAILGMSAATLVRGVRRAGADEAPRRRLAILGAWLLFTFVLSLKQGSLLGNPLFFMFAILLGRYVRGLGSVAVRAPTGARPIRHRPGPVGARAPRRDMTA